MAAVIFKNAFKYDWHIANGDEYDFLGYMTRPEAFVPEKHKQKSSEYYDYMEYMRNDEKSDGAFDSINDYLDDKQREAYRNYERISQTEGCPKYTGVLSFQNEFLENNGFLKGNHLNTAELRNIARKGMNALITKSDKLSADNCYWVAAIHRNTDNIHIHYSLCEYHRLSDRKITEKNNKQDCLEIAAFNALKSAVANSIITVKRTPELTKFKRDILIPELKAGFPSAEKLLLELAAELPADAAMQYNNHKIRPYHNKINQCIDRIISSDKQLKDDWERYTDSLRYMDEQYKEFYGEKSHFDNYSENQIDDFYVRAGNALLKHIVSIRRKVEQPELPDIDDIIKLTAEDFEWSYENQISPDIDYFSKSKYYLKWSNAYKEACKLIYNKKSKLEDFQKAKELLVSEAKSGNVLAIHDLAKLYSTEKLGSKNEERSFAYYKEALQGFMETEPDSDFMFSYEPKYEGQIMKPVDMRSYVRYRIGKMHCYGLGTEQNYEQAFEWFLKSATEGNKSAQYSLADLYYHGNGVEKDLSQAFFWYQKSAYQGQPYASYAVAQMYNKGEYVDQSENTAHRYYKQALSGFLKIESDGMMDDNLFYKIGAMYKNGLGTEKDIVKAIDYFKRSAEMNNKNGLYEYGKALLLGEHISQDKDKAVKLLEKAIKLGSVNEKRFLALEYISGEHLEQDIEKGLAMLTECADRGDTMSCYKLGKIYLNGEIVLQNLNKAEKYLLKSAETDYPYAQYELGKLYLDNRKLNIKKAGKWLLKAADNNHSYAQFAYGVLSYKLGDHEEGIYYLQQAAQNGNEVALSLIKNLSDYQKSKRPVVRKAIYKSRRSVNAAWYALKELQNEYDAHIKQLQRQFDYENQISPDIEYTY